MVIFTLMHACVQGEGESPSAMGIFCWLCHSHQLLHFKGAGQSLPVHFPVLNMSLPGETLPGKMQLPFFRSFTDVMLQWKAYKNRVLCCQYRLAEKNVGQIYKYCEIFTCGTP